LQLGAVWYCRLLAVAKSKTYEYSSIFVVQDQVSLVFEKRVYTPNSRKPKSPWSDFKDLFFLMQSLPKLFVNSTQVLLANLG
jgi:hypothetical protein